MIALGIWAYIERNRYELGGLETVADFFFDLSIIFIVAGIVIFILASAGCVGALRETTALLKMYYISLMIIFLLEVVGAVLVFVFRDKVKTELENILEDNLITRYIDDPDLEKVIDFFQEEFFCCGVGDNGYKEWNNNQYFNCSGLNLGGLKCGVPYSCRKNQEDIVPGLTNLFCGGGVLSDTISLTQASDKIYTDGCFNIVLRIAEDNMPMIGGIIIGVVVPQLLGICLARMLEGQITDQIARWNREGQGYRQH